MSRGSALSKINDAKDCTVAGQRKGFIPEGLEERGERSGQRGFIAFKLGIFEDEKARSSRQSELHD